MITHSGRNVWPHDQGVPTLTDIGIGLGRIPRFAGQTEEWYPVLAHVLTCARLLPGRIALHGLMHDAPEAVVSDVPTPWKTVAAKRREGMLLKRMYKHYKLAWPSDEDWDEIYRVDHAVLIAEAHALGHYDAVNGGSYWLDPDPLVVEMTEGMLEMCREMIEPYVSGPIFQEAYHTYHRLLDRE